MYKERLKRIYADAVVKIPSMIKKVSIANIRSAAEDDYASKEEYVDLFLREHDKLVASGREARLFSAWFWWFVIDNSYLKFSECLYRDWETTNNYPVAT